MTMQISSIVRHNEGIFVKLLFYLITVYYIIYLIYNLLFLYIETREIKEKTIEDLKSLVKTKEGKLIQQVQYFQYCR